MTGFAAGLRRVESYFLEERPTSAAWWLRAFLAGWTLVFALSHLPHVEVLYARPVLRTAAPTWALLGDPVPSPLLARAVFLAVIGAAGWLLAGSLRRPAPRGLVVPHAALVVGLGLLLQWDDGAFRGYGKLALLQLFLLLLGPPCRDRAGFSLRLVQIQLASVYAFTVLSKLLEGSGWLDGTAIARAFANPSYGDHLLSALHHPRGLEAQLLALGTVGAEAFVAIGLLVSPLRRGALLALVGLHLGMALSLRVSLLFSALMIGHVLAFSPLGSVPKSVEALRRR